MTLLISASPLELRHIGFVGEGPQASSEAAISGIVLLDRYRLLAPFVGDFLVPIFARVLAVRFDGLLAPIGLGRACLG